MKKVFVFLIALLSIAAVQAQKMDDAQIKQKINQAAVSMQTMQCDFVQTKYLKMLNDKMVSKGKMYYQQSNKLRWEYLSPYTYTFILNDSKVLIKNNQRNDVIDVKQNKVFKEIARIMMNCVVGKCLSDEKDFNVSIAENSMEWVATLTPIKKDMRQMFQKIILHFNRQHSMVAQVELIEKNNDRTLIELKNVHTNEAIRPEIFAID